VLECVVNISEGCREDLVDAVASRAGQCLLDVHIDAHHHRAVLTLAGPGNEVEQAARAVASEAVAQLDIALHSGGVHPRLGVVDVVPFVPLGSATMRDAVGARDRFALWAASGLGVPCFLYGPERTLPEIRRRAFTGLVPDTGPLVAHPSAGAICVGARPVLVAYNLWLDWPSKVDGGDVPALVGVARAIAGAIRRPAVRALGLAVGGRAQVSLNLIAPSSFGPADAYDEVESLARAAGVELKRAELVGLVPDDVLARVPFHRRGQLDLDSDRTIGSRLGAVRPKRPR